MSALNPVELNDIPAAAILRTARQRLHALASDVFEPSGVDREVLSDRLDALSDPPERPSKSDCKLLKLATFGEVRSAKGSLRHDANVLQVFGIEGDYDAGVMTPAEAAELLAQGGVESLVYTTPSHKLGAPRWRVLCPLSSSCSPQERAQHLDKLDAILGGVLADESWTISQTYYVGKVAGSPYETHHVRGVCIDTLPSVEAASPAVVAPPTVQASTADDEMVFDVL